jgi:ABC-type phosphate transport system substrate-binding protein
LDHRTPCATGRNGDAVSVAACEVLLFMARPGHVFRALMMVLSLVAICASCKRTSGRSVNLLGSTSIQPFAEILAERYTKNYPGQFV